MRLNTNNRGYNKLLTYRNHYFKNGGYEINAPWITGNESSTWASDYLRIALPSNPATTLDRPLNIPNGSIDITTFGDAYNDNPGSLSDETMRQVEEAQSATYNAAHPQNKSMNALTSNVGRTIASGVGGLASNAISGGLHSGVGSALNSLGNIASAIPGPWGAVGIGLKVVGGITNRLAGSKFNEENIAKVEGNINKLNSIKSDANSFDTLAQNISSTNLGSSFSKKYIGSEGPLSTKVKKKYNQLKNDFNIAKDYATNSFENNAMNLKENMLNNLDANYAAFGGILNTNGATFPTGLTFINEGDTHENSPYGGVPMGVAPDGKPNLVEEGETVYNNYVFSNRLTVPKAVRSKYKLRGNEDLTFADAVKQLSKVATERPNDPISQETLHEIMSDLVQTQEGIREEAQQDNRFDKGGFTYKPYKYVAGYNGGWFDDNGKYTQDYLDKVNSMSIADINNAFNEQYKFYTNDANKDTDRWKAIDAFYTINPQYKTANTNLTNDALPTIRALATDGNPGFMHQFFNDASKLKDSSLKSPVSIKTPVVSTTPDQKDEDLYPIDLGTANEYLRYIPAVGLGLASISDALGLSNKPDYGEAARIEAATRGDSYMPVSWNPIGNKLTYRPFDRDYYTNKLNAESGATRRAIANQSGGNSGRAIAGILAADYNAQNQLGDLFRKSEEYNLEQRQKVEDFNRATNQVNSQGMLQADMANQNAFASARESNLRGLMAAAELRQKAKLAADQAKSANLSGLLQSLGDIGYENKSMNMIRRLAEAGVFGPLSEPMVKNVATKKAYNKNYNSLTRRRKRG